MRFSLGLPTHQLEPPGEFVGPGAVSEAARAVERAGFDACYVTDHPFPGDRWLREGGHHALDPFVVLSFAAAATEVLRLQTHILVLPYRNPFLTANSVASLDQLSGGRLILGVAAGYQRAEFAALGADFENRNRVVDDCIEAMKSAWHTDDLRLRGDGFHAVGNTLRPRPAQRPHPPIWVGGNSKRAIRSAVEHGDGWAPFPNPAALAPHTRTARIENLSDLAERIDHVRAWSEKVERESPLEICYSLGSFPEGDFDAAALRDSVGALTELGVGWVTVRIETSRLAAYCDAAQRFGEEVIRDFDGSSNRGA